MTKATLLFIERYEQGNTTSGELTLEGITERADHWTYRGTDADTFNEVIANAISNGAEIEYNEERLTAEFIFWK